MTFKQLRSKFIPSLQAEVQEFEDSATGARHIHLANASDELVFLVGFPTVPDVSDGRAHILEHIALCGSARYPVRDPFFAMLRRSTAHFMNAMTYADKTVYPFASTDRRDFFNLLDVYLDAAFFPNLEYLDFLQEGWRLTFEEGKLCYQGIVFNEMKGAFADPLRALDMGIGAHLLRGTTYAVESGGDPLVIPSLTHEALKEFHSTHYHPSQAVFMTAGRIAPSEVQQAIEDRVLSKLSGRAPRLTPDLAPAWNAPEQATVAVPTSEFGVQIAWLLGESVDPVAYHHAQLLEAGLLGNASAPLMRAMEGAGFGRPSTLNGVDSGIRQMVFHLGMEGLTEKQIPQARKRIWSALETAAREGVPASLLQASLRDLRFAQREIANGGMPDAMHRLLDAIPYEMYGGDIMNGFDQDAILGQLQEKIADPAFFKGLARQLLDSPTRLDVSVMPDQAFFSNRKKLEDERLAQLQDALSPADKERLQAEASALLERQRKPVNNDLLPRIRPEDVSPLPRPAVELPAPHQGAVALTIPSNGISYGHVLYDVSGIDESDWPWIQLYTDLLPDLGVGSRNYEDADAWRHEKVPHFEVHIRAEQRQDDSHSLRLFVDFSARGLREEQAGIAEVLSESILSPRFDEKERIAFLIDSMVQDLRNNLADQGDDFARLAASAPFSPLRRFETCISGADSLAFYAALHRKSKTAQGLDAICTRLRELRERMLQSEATVITAGVEQDGAALAAMLTLPRVSGAMSTATSVPSRRAPNTLALHAPAQVNHCFAAWEAPNLAHPDAAKLAVLGELLTNLVLHQALREEGGAYGGQASYSPETGAFVMMSYRDPRLAATYADFQRALEWLMSAELKQENIEEAIICVVRDLDAPHTPYEEVIRAWERKQQGITEEMRQQFRNGVLHCTADEIKAAAANWLLGKPCSRVAFASSVEQDLAGLEVVSLVELAA